MIDDAMFSLIKGIAEFQGSSLMGCDICNQFYKKHKIGEHSLGYQICVPCYNEIMESDDPELFLL